MPAPALYGVILCAVLMASFGTWSWSHRDPTRTRRTAENIALSLSVVLIAAALWAALLMPWPHK